MQRGFAATIFIFSLLIAINFHAPKRTTKHETLVAYNWSACWLNIKPYKFNKNKSGFTSIFILLIRNMPWYIWLFFNTDHCQTNTDIKCDWVFLMNLVTKYTTLSSLRSACPGIGLVRGRAPESAKRRRLKTDACFKRSIYKAGQAACGRSGPIIFGSYCAGTGTPVLSGTVSHAGKREPCGNHPGRCGL